MAYECQNFKDGQVLTAKCLNRMEKGIEDACSGVKTVNGISPDENGNVEIEGGGGGTATPGADGFSPVANVVQTDSGVVISITDKYGTTTATVTSGKDGADGKDGAKGDKGDPGEKGDTGATGPQGIQGETGPAGEKGATGAKGEKGDAFTYADFTADQLAALKGEKGDKGDQGIQGEKGETGAAGSNGADGKDGANGTSVTVKSVSESTADGGSNVVTFSDGKTLTVKNGSKGSKGDKGDKGDTGATGAAGAAGADGADYVLTEADKSEIAALVIEMLGGNPIFGIVDENNNIVVSGDLPDGTYSIKYEMENGNTVNIGNLVLDTNVYYTVTNNLTQCTTNNSATKAVQGGSYSATITAKSGYELKSIVVKMGGTDISSTAVSGGKITISNVTGNIVITAVAEEIKAAYTNLAKTFTTGSRLNSSYTITTSTLQNSVVCDDYIPFEAGTTVRIKGLRMGTVDGVNHCVAFLNASKANLASNNHTYPGENGSKTINWKKETDEVYQYNNVNNADCKYMRISGVLVGSTSDVIITKNEPIA